MEGAWKDMQLGRDASSCQALCVLDVLIQEKIRFTHDYESQG